MSEPQTSVFYVESCLYGSYIGQYVTAGVAGTAGTAGHLHHMALLLPHSPIVLSHSIFSLSKYV